MASVGQNIALDSAAGHVSGTSRFLDDVAPLAGELLAGIVPSPVAHGRVKRLDVSAARAIPGVAAVLTRQDIPGHNLFGPAIKDELLLVEDEAVFLGQPLAIIAAENAEALDEARKAVVAEIDELPAIFSIDQAIAAESYLNQPRLIERGEVAAGLLSAVHRIEGVLDIGGQEHFYLESHIAIAVPGEARTMTVHSSTQGPTEVQTLVAEVLDVPFNHVVVICPRMGGGFGGKETQAAQPAMIAALLAAKTNRPVRFIYNKDDDMRFTGKRHPFKAAYQAGVDHHGRIVALDIQLWSNGGCSTDLSMAVLERAMLHVDNAYYLPNVRIRARVCKTNLPSNTAFRGFGGPQGVAAMEALIEEIAFRLKRDALDIRQLNCYGIHDRNTTPYGEIVRNNTLPELFDSLRRECDYDRRRDEIGRFNRDSHTHLKGLSLSPVKFGISFSRRTMNQANALVNIYLDGSVLVSTGATEMGQGVNTRIRQIVADELGIDFGRVLLTATSTDKNNNTSPTAASVGTEINGHAAADACRRLRARLAIVAAEMLASPDDGRPPEPAAIQFVSGSVCDSRYPSKTLPFEKIVSQAYEQRVSLGERGFYATPGVDFNRATGRGSPFLYFTMGVAASEVLIDRLTGEMKVARVDLIMDAGKSINPGIDRGQIVGGFIQGMGWVTTEELLWNAKGELLSHSPTTYKIPNISDLPDIFNVRLLENPNNDVSLHRSKAVGEPPLLLGISVWLAVKNALSYLAKDQPAKLSIPATGERILMGMEAVAAAPTAAHAGR
ncbi:MAG TPA: xanthine dehydrogenase molybdopterin binding subunit [Tepidisphaeraceae bacterium]|nr:xanthine dehydrogenase molybdopterin binding subunit [Tepidisphaeraceae bacterium]